MLMFGKKGFTLIELMIVVAVIAILAAVAYPSYQDSVRKSRRADAKAVLTELAQWMERNYTEAHRYDQNKAGAAIDTAALPFDKAPKDGNDTYYNITVATGANTFTLTATPANAQAGDKCGSLTLNQAGQKGVTGAAAGVTAADCW